MNVWGRLAIAILLLLAVTGAGVWHIKASTSDTRWLSAETIATASSAPSTASQTDPSDDDGFLDEAVPTEAATGNGQIDLILADVRTSTTQWLLGTMLFAFLTSVFWTLYAEAIRAKVGGPQGLRKAGGVWFGALFVLLLGWSGVTFYFYSASQLVELMSLNSFLFRGFTFLALGAAGYWLATLAGAARMMRSSVPMGSVLP